MAHWLDTREVMEAVGLGHLLKVGSARCPISGRFVGNQEPSDDEVVENLREPSYDPNAEYEAAQGESECVDDVFDPIWDYGFTANEDSEDTFSDGHHSYCFDEDDNQYPHDFNGDDYPDNDEEVPNGEDYEGEFLAVGLTETTEEDDPVIDQAEVTPRTDRINNTVSQYAKKARGFHESHGTHGRKPILRRQKICRGYKQEEFDSRISS